MGTPTDLPLAIPGTGPPAVPSHPAGVDPVPMADVVMSQPVIAYFTFIQNNLHGWGKRRPSDEGSRTTAPSDHEWSTSECEEGMEQ